MDESPVQLQHKYEKKSSDPLPNLGSSKEKKKNPVYKKAMRKVDPRKNKRAPLVVGPASSGEEERRGKKN